MVADAVASTGNIDAAIRIEDAIGGTSDDALLAVYGDSDLLLIAEQFQLVGERFESVDRALKQPKMVGDVVIQSAGLSSAAYPPANICSESPDRNDTASTFASLQAIQTSRVALETAKGVWSAASRACDQVAVVAGFGGNPSLACIAADAVLAAAELAVGIAENNYAELEFCDASVDSAEIEGSYDRLGHLHGDLETHESDIKTQVAAHDAAIQAQVAAHDAAIAAQVAAHDAAIQAQVATHDAEIKALLANLQGAVDENQRLIKITMSRQLEVMRLLITPQGRREINPDVLSCTGDDCPAVPAVLGCGTEFPCK